MIAHGLAVLANARLNLLSRRGALRRLGAVTTLSIAGAWPLGQTAGQTETTEVGRASAGQRAFQLVGTIEQRGFDFTMYGFLTRVADLDSDRLFTDDDTLNQTAATARMTFHGEATAAARSVHHPLFVVDASGTITFYVNQRGGAGFESPESFSEGTAVTRATLAVQNIVNVQAPQLGVVTGFAHLYLERSDPFALGDDEYVFGHAGMEARLSYAGQGVLLDPGLPEAVITFAGAAVTVA